jgi:hypothetical protein
MSELGEDFKAYREMKRTKRADNHARAEKILKEKQIPHIRLSASHYRVGAFDFWPATGLFIERRTGKRGRGIFNLLKRVSSNQFTETK